MHETPIRQNYSKIIAEWLNGPDDSESVPALRIGFLRRSTEDVLIEAGLSGAELAAELARFDAAAQEHFSGGPASKLQQAAGTDVGIGSRPMPDQTAHLPNDGPARGHSNLAGLAEPLGVVRWIGVIYLSGGLAAAAAAALGALLKPLVDAATLPVSTMVVACLGLVAIVFGAAVPTVADTVRRYRGLGFVLFWLPVFLFVGVVTVFPPLLIKQLTDSMGADFLPLALPLASLLFFAIALPALWIVARRVVGRRAPLAESGATDRIHPLMAVLLTAFSILFFLKGAEVMLGWGTGPALVCGLLVTGLIVRIFKPAEIGIWFVIALALPLALLAAELPPGSLSALTILLLSLAAAFAAKWVMRLRGQRLTTFYSGLTAAALALLLVIAPTGPAGRVSQAIGKPLQFVAEAVVGGYAWLYKTEFGHAALAALAGFRSSAAAVRADAYDYDPAGRRYVVTLDVLNLGEQGIERILFHLADAPGPGNDGCGPVEIDHGFAEPVWPGDRAQVTVAWMAPAGCPAKSAAALAERITADIREQGWDNRIESRVLATRRSDPAGRFKNDARVWLEL